MSELLPGLILLAVGGSIAPPLLLLTLLFLGSRRPLPNATALALGYLYYLHGYRYLRTRSLRRCGACRFHPRQGHQRNGRGPAHRPGLKEPAQCPRSRRVAARVDGTYRLHVAAQGVRDRDGALPAAGSALYSERSSLSEAYWGPKSMGHRGRSATGTPIRGMAQAAKSQRPMSGFLSFLPYGLRVSRASGEYCG
jgi:hypothetical protein